VRTSKSILEIAILLWRRAASSPRKEKAMKHKNALDPDGLPVKKLPTWTSFVRQTIPEQDKEFWVNDRYRVTKRRVIILAAGVPAP
jgi:hypothetical protein